MFSSFQIRISTFHSRPTFTPLKFKNTLVFFLSFVMMTFKTSFTLASKKLSVPSPSKLKRSVHHSPLSSYLTTLLHYQTIILEQFKKYINDLIIVHSSTSYSLFFFHFYHHLLLEVTTTTNYTMLL